MNHYKDMRTELYTQWRRPYIPGPYSEERQVWDGPVGSSVVWCTNMLLPNVASGTTKSRGKGVVVAPTNSGPSPASV